MHAEPLRISAVHLNKNCLHSRGAAFLKYVNLGSFRPFAAVVLNDACADEAEVRSIKCVGEDCVQGGAGSSQNRERLELVGIPE